MSETITAESLLDAGNENDGQKMDTEQEVDNSPDVQDENLENKESLEENADGDVQDQSDEETPETETSEDDENVQTDSQTESDESSEEKQDVEEKSEKPEIPKWVEKRLQRQDRKHERELSDYKQQVEKQVEQYIGNLANNNAYIDQSTQIQDPFTGNIVAKDSVEGQVILKMQQLSDVKAQTEKQTKIQQAQEDLKRKLAKGYDKFDDFHDVVDNSGISMTMLEAASLSETPDELLYNLAKYKPEEIDRISKLSPERQFREMVLLETEMKQSTKKKIVKKVPEPPSKIKGSGASLKDESDFTFEELLSFRRKKERERMRR